MQSSFGISAVLRVFNDSAGDIRSKVIGIYAFLVTLNVAAWALSFAAFAHHPLLLGTALLAYTFGLRHSVDADHISAIDNVTRKLMQEGKRPVAVGFFFSLGHSTIVVALSVGIAIAAAVVKNSIPSLQNLGGLIGTSVSAAFLFVIAIINMLVLWDIFRTFQTVKRGGEYNDRTLEEFLSQRGLMGRFFKPLLRLVRTSWHMYPIG
ncbi:MAG: HoxN/HupN/NixA family nickel/cobalt transporter, partial [Candidatus Eremiobacteraeota bacterium]|nr:HoxN/HupN/NixA family nickel/cobalt transporter [Candidatus Eremiobacteraeota bacterium]